MESFGQLDKYTIDRMERVLGEKNKENLKNSIKQVVNDLLLDGYAPEDIHDYVRGVLIEEIEE
jgi:uncharacterized protein (UPF0335 family)